MPTFSIPYGRGEVQVVLPDELRPITIAPKETHGSTQPFVVINQALDQQTALIASLLSTAKSAAIAVNDKTRPVPHHILLPLLLDRLVKGGLLPQAITLFIASGTHTPMPSEEFSLILPEAIIASYAIVSHDCDDAPNLVYLGKTSRGTPVSINRRFLEADLRIVVGNIEPHHFMGFSGAAKSASIGLAGRETITHNHLMLLDPASKVGEYENNPMRQDVEEIGSMIGIHFALNVILNDKKEIVSALAGDPQEVMRVGVQQSRQICQTAVSQRFDLVIASAGGYPKDINLYQAQKALTHASLIAKENGVVILVAECCEGIGSAALEEFMRDINSADEIREKFERMGFRIGPHKAYQIVKIAEHLKIILVSAIPAGAISKYPIWPVSSLEEAIHLALDWLPPAPEIALLPKATQTIPILDH